jgi:hypothetical protein
MRREATNQAPMARLLITYQNKRVVYDLLMKAAAETTPEIAADPKRLGARMGVTAVLHTSGRTAIPPVSKFLLPTLPDLYLGISVAPSMDSHVRSMYNSCCLARS